MEKRKPEEKAKQLISKLGCRLTAMAYQKGRVDVLKEYGIISEFEKQILIELNNL